MMRALFLALLLLSGCTTGPGNKPDTLKWKTYKDVTPLKLPAATWTKGSLEYKLTQASYVRRYTILGTSSIGLNFDFSITNRGSAEANVFDGMPKGALTLQDGTVIDRLIWTAAKVKLPAGGATTGMYFTDASLKEGARPKVLAIDGNAVAGWEN